MSEDTPSGPLDHDFTPPMGIERPLTDSEATTALAEGNTSVFVRWMTQQQIEAARRPDTSLEYSLQIRIAMAYANAARMVGRKEQSKLHAEALSILTKANESITGALDALSRMTPEEAKLHNRDDRMRELHNLVKDIINLRAEIMRK